MVPASRTQRVRISKNSMNNAWTGTEYAVRWPLRRPSSRGTKQQTEKSVSFLEDIERSATELIPPTKSLSSSNLERLLQNIRCGSVVLGYQLLARTTTRRRVQMNPRLTICIVKCDYTREEVNHIKWIAQDSERTCGALYLDLR